jgi:8-oxo-dGTP pyrophosphatase MutT (NUDIX family)
MSSIRHRVRKGLASLKPRSLSVRYTSEAAVLMPIFEKEGEPHFLLTRRTEEVQTHKGQISFPGGMREGNESLERTALRETFEEVGIDEGGIQILGRFHDYLSVTDSRVVPFAGYIPGPFDPKPHVAEVAEILYVPFHVFLDPSRLRIERWNRKGQDVDVYFFSYGPYEIWGLTARIIHDFLGEIGLR